MISFNFYERLLYLSGYTKRSAQSYKSNLRWILKNSNIDEQEFINHPLKYKEILFEKNSSGLRRRIKCLEKYFEFIGLEKPIKLEIILKGSDVINNGLENNIYRFFNILKTEINKENFGETTDDKFNIESIKKGCVIVTGLLASLKVLSLIICLKKIFKSRPTSLKGKIISISDFSSKFIGFLLEFISLLIADGFTSIVFNVLGETINISTELLICIFEKHNKNTKENG